MTSINIYRDAYTNVLIVIVWLSSTTIPIP